MNMQKLLEAVDLLDLAAFAVIVVGASYTAFSFGKLLALVGGA